MKMLFWIFPLSIIIISLFVAVLLLRRKRAQSGAEKADPATPELKPLQEPEELIDRQSEVESLLETKSEVSSTGREGAKTPAEEPSPSVKESATPAEESLFTSLLSAFSDEKLLSPMPVTVVTEDTLKSGEGVELGSAGIPETESTTASSESVPASTPASSALTETLPVQAEEKEEKRIELPSSDEFERAFELPPASAVQERQLPGTAVSAAESELQPSILGTDAARAENHFQSVFAPEKQEAIVETPSEPIRTSSDESPEGKPETRRVELYFEDGTKTTIAPDSSYYDDFLKFTDRLLGKDAKW